MLYWSDILDTASSNFDEAAEELRNVHSVDFEEMRRCIADAVIDKGSMFAVTGLYLLAEVGMVDHAVAIGTSLLADYPNEETVLIGLADMLHRQGNERPAFELTSRLVSPSASDALINKHCDFARDLGLGFVAERLLTTAVREGRTTLLPRLAEHHREHRNWSALLECLNKAPDELLSLPLLFLRGRAAVSLLMEQEVIATADRLWVAEEPGPAYAQLLLDVWRWRVGDIESEPPVPPNTELSYWAMHDAQAIRSAPEPGHAPETIVRSSSGWRALRPRENLPNVLMIGAQRAATTWLWQNLLRHPEVQPLPWKESVFFSDAFASPFDVDPGLAAISSSEDMSYWSGPTRNLFRYCRLFGAGFPVRADFSPTYAELPDESVDVLRDLLGPDVRILFCVRDLVDRAWSNLKFDLKLSGHRVEDIDLQARISHYTSDVAMRRADYVGTINRWSRRFANFSVLFFDEIITNPDEVARKVEDAIGMTGTDASGRPVVTHPINESLQDDLPAADRAFLLGLHQDNYRRALGYFGNRVANWIMKHEAALS